MASPVRVSSILRELLDRLQARTVGLSQDSRMAMLCSTASCQFALARHRVDVQAMRTSTGTLLRLQAEAVVEAEAQLRTVLHSQMGRMKTTPLPREEVVDGAVCLKRAHVLNALHVASLDTAKLNAGMHIQS